MTGKASARPPLLDSFGTVIDMVEDAGADPTGNESINPLLEKRADDDTVLVFPPGRYRMNRQFHFTGFNNFGIYGKWNVTIVPDNYYDFDDGGDWNYRLFRLGVDYAPGKDLLFKNITVDQTAKNTGIRVLDAAVSDGLKVRNVNTWGASRQRDVGTASGRHHRPRRLRRRPGLPRTRWRFLDRKYAGRQTLARSDGYPL